jgi:hypothetical protein
MQRFQEGQEVQSLVDRGAPILTVIAVRRIPERVQGVENYLYQCENGKWYVANELGKYINPNIIY